MRNALSYRIVSLCLALCICCFIPVEPVIAVDSNEDVAPLVAMDRYIEYYTINEETYFPSYFVGMTTTNDALIMYLTDLDPEKVAEVNRICASDCIEVAKCDFSMEELEEFQSAVLNKKDAYGLEGSSFDFENSGVIFYTKEMSSDYSRSSGSALTDLEDRIASDFSGYDVALNVRCEYIPVDDNDEIPDTLSVAAQEATTYASTAFAPGMPTSYTMSGDTYIGTVSILGLNSAGNKILFTHGHDYESGKQTVTINGSTYTAKYLSSSESVDAAYINLGSSASITNATHYNARPITAVYSATAIKSLSNVSAYFAGTGSGGEYSTKISYYTDGDAPMIKFESATYAVKGDSGGPIFVYTSSSNYKLAGFVKSSGSGWALGTLASNLKSAYQSATGYTLYFQLK